MQENNDITKKITEKIDSFDGGKIFYIQEFLDIADYDSIKTILSRLEKSGYIRRVTRGYYDKPVYNTRIGEYVEPSPKKVADAIAERNGWQIAPSGNTALNYLGISTQVPNIWEFISTGPSREYELSNAKIIFTHREDREFRGLSPKTILAMQALRAISSEQVTDEMLSNFAMHFSADDTKKLLDEGKNLPLKTYNYFKRISDLVNKVDKGELTNA